MPLISGLLPRLSPYVNPTVLLRTKIRKNIRLILTFLLISFEVEVLYQNTHEISEIFIILIFSRQRLIISTERPRLSSRWDRRFSFGCRSTGVSGHGTRRTVFQRITQKYRGTVPSSSLQRGRGFWRRVTRVGRLPLLSPPQSLFLSFLTRRERYLSVCRQV